VFCPIAGLCPKQKILEPQNFIDKPHGPGKEKEAVRGTCQQVRCLAEESLPLLDV
jgi:hypothetical protein